MNAFSDDISKLALGLVWYSVAALPQLRVWPELATCADRLWYFVGREIECVCIGLDKIVQESLDL